MMQHWNYFAPILLLMVLNVRFSFGFKAAVFEHAEQSDNIMSTDPKKIIDTNLKYYTVAVEKARSEGVDIMVFPEYGIFPPHARRRFKSLFEYIPDPNVTGSNPCEDPEAYADRPILYNLSCLARKNEMILVANMGDIQPCTGEGKCKVDGAFYFSTNVAFDRDGTLLAKYHSGHPFLEPGMDDPVRGQDPTFQTDLGRFAMFVNFDIFFKRMTDVAQWKDVKAVLLPTMWINDPPLYNSIQYFEAWAVGNDATLLAANIHLPEISIIGSGIYRGRDGAQVYTFNPDGRSKLLISDLEVGEPDSSSIHIVTLNGTQEWTDDGRDVADVCSIKGPYKDTYKYHRCEERDMQNFTLQKLVKSYGRVEVCNNGMCCSLDYSATGMILKEDFYLAVYNGTLSTGDRYGLEAESCILARCDGYENESCVTLPMRSKTRFYNVYLRANFSTPFIYPSVVSSGMRLTPKRLWRFETDGRIATIHSNGFAGNDLLTVQLTARAYDRDPPYG